MSIIRRPTTLIRGPQYVPTYPVEINWSHPLSRDLIGLWVPGNSGGINLVDGNPLFSYVGAATIGGSAKGPGAVTPSATGGGLINTTAMPAKFQLGASMTVFTLGTYGAAGFLGGQNPTVFGNDLAAAPYLSYGLVLNGASGVVKMQAFISKSSSAFLQVTDTNLLASYGVRPLLAAFTLSGNIVVLYVDTNAVTNTSYSGSPYYGSFSSFGFGEPTSAARSPNWTAASGGVYSRPLSSGEIAWLRAEPFDMLRPKREVWYYSAPSGGTTAYLALRGMSFSSGIFANTTASNLAMRALSATQGRAANDATAQTSTRGNSITSGVGSTAGLGYVAARGGAVSAGREATNALASVAARANSVTSGREANTASAQIAARGLSSTSGRMSLFAASTFALVAGRGLAASFARMAVTATAGVAAVAGRGFAASFGRLSLWKAPPPKTPYVIPTTPTHFSIPSGKTIYNIPTTKSDESDPG